MVYCCMRKCTFRTGGRKKDPGNAVPEKVGSFGIPAILSRGCDKTKEYSRQRRHLWIKRINKPHVNLNSKHIRVCGRHFITGRPAALFDVTNPDWAPSLHLGYDSPQHSLRLRSNMERYQRAKERNRRKKEVAAAKALPMEPVQHSPAAKSPTVATVEIWNAAEGEPAHALPIITDVRSIAGEPGGESIFAEEQGPGEEESAEAGLPVSCAAAGQRAEPSVRDRQVQTHYVMSYLDQLESGNRELRKKVIALKEELARATDLDSTRELVGQLEADNRELRKEVYFLQGKLMEALPAEDVYRLLRQGGSTATLRRLVGRQPTAKSPVVTTSLNGVTKV